MADLDLLVLESKDPKKSASTSCTYLRDHAFTEQLQRARRQNSGLLRVRFSQRGRRSHTPFAMRTGGHTDKG